MNLVSSFCQFVFRDEGLSGISSFDFRKWLMNEEYTGGKVQYGLDEL